ncbi:MAG: hypothetical protein WDZ40_02665 [Candidatus Spechtbacterales bacterium]
MKEVFKAAFDAFNEVYINGDSKTETEARKTAQTAWRVSGKIKNKADYWLRLASAVVGIWFLLALGAALLPLESLGQVLMVLPLIAIGMIWFSQPAIVTTLFSWDKTRGGAQTVATIALFQAFAGFVIWLVPLHAAREMTLPFVFVLVMIGLSYLSLNNRGVRAIRKFLMVIAIIMVFGFWAAEDNAATTEPQAQEQSTVVVVYEQPVTTVVRTPSTPTSKPEKVSPAPVVNNEPQPAVHEFPEEAPSFGIWAEASPYVAHPGDVVRITVVVGNHGRGDAKNPVVTIGLPQGLIFAETGKRVQTWSLEDIPKNVGERSLGVTILVESTTPPGGYDFIVTVTAENLPQEFSVPRSLVVNAA